MVEILFIHSKKVHILFPDELDVVYHAVKCETTSNWVYLFAICNPFFAWLEIFSVKCGIDEYVRVCTGKSITADVHCTYMID